MPSLVVTFAKLDLINQACTALGETEISDIESDESTSAIVMRRHYDAVRLFCLCKTAWRFNTTKAQLGLLSGAPKSRWAASWQLPPDNLKVLTTWPPSSYEIQGDRLLSNETGSMYLDYQRAVTEQLWPAWFSRYFVAELVMRTCRGITGDAPDAEMVRERKEAEADALFQDSQQQPNQTLATDDFVNVRR